MGMCKELYLYGRENDLRYCYAILEKPLLRLVRSLGLPFEVIGNPTSCMNGQCFPAMLDLHLAKAKVRETNKFFYDYANSPREEQAQWF